MVKSRQLMCLIALTIFGCGDETTTLAKAYPSVASLPACNGSMEGTFALVEETGILHVCNGTTWQGNAPMKIVANEDALPECTDANRGALALIEDTSATSVCTSEGWAVSQIVMFSLFCQGDLVHAALPDGLSYHYRNVQISPTGDTWVSGMIISSFSQITGTALYSWQQEGATIGAVLVADDWVGDFNHGYWSFTVDVDAEEMQIDYSDPDLPDPGSLTLTVPFDDEACSLQAY